MKSDNQKSQKPYSSKRWQGSANELRNYIGEDLDDPDVNLETRKKWDKVMSAFDKAYDQNKKK